MTTRREFVKTGAAALSLTALGSRRADALAGLANPAAPMDASVKALLMDALNAAKMAGAGYADARIGHYRQNFVVTREKQIIQVVDTDTMGCGVRVLVDGTWGFAATRTLTADGVAGAAKEAVTIAKANRIARDRAVELAPTPSVGEVSWTSGFVTDPFSIPVEQKADLLIKANTEAMKVAGVKFVNSSMFFVKEDKNYANTDGAVINQMIVRSWLPM